MLGLRSDLGYSLQVEMSQVSLWGWNTEVGELEYLGY